MTMLHLLPAHITFGDGALVLAAVALGAALGVLFAPALRRVFRRR